MSSLETLWFGRGIGARLARGALMPAEGVYRAVVGARNALFDLGWRSAADPPVPCLSVGNLTVGGTGKTPVAAWLARRLADAGARPALVLRGYGDDEPRVHALLNPDVPVLTNPRRMIGIDAARARGCDVVVLDDAFQHRQVRRLEDLVLIATEQWTGRRGVRCLPAGPYREPLQALRRATCILVTRKSASPDESVAVAKALATTTAAPIGRVVLALDALRRVGGDGGSAPLSTVHGARVLAFAGIGAPEAFARQLAGAGGEVTLIPFPDHHGYTPADVARLVAHARVADVVVCTLKDAVKVAPHWPRQGPALWYVSQRIELEDRAGAVDTLLDHLLHPDVLHAHR